MTDHFADERPVPDRRPPSEGTSPRVPTRDRGHRTALAVAWAAVAIFLAVMAVLAMRVAAGGDPALRTRAVAAARPARHILIRRIYERRVIIHLPASAPAQPTQSSQQVTASGASTAPLVTHTS
jgi:hypothetical protein